MPRVFLSYRHVEPDQSIARFIYRYLVDQDHEVFFDSVDIPLGAFWNKEIKTNVERTEYFVPLVSLAYLNSPYIRENELSVAAQLPKDKKIEGTLQVNLAFDGKPPDAVQDVVNQIQFFKWRSPADISQVARSLAAVLPAPRALVKGMRSFTTTDAPQFLQLGRAERVSQFVSAFRSFCVARSTLPQTRTDVADLRNRVLPLCKAGVALGVGETRAVIKV